MENILNDYRKNEFDEAVGVRWGLVEVDLGEEDDDEVAHEDAKDLERCFVGAS
jgi:hypothetical protein